MTNQFYLFEESEEKNEILTRDGKVLYYKDFFDASNLFKKLTEEIPWQQDQINMFGKVYQVPRLQAWFGITAYSYSGIELKIFPWNSDDEVELGKNPVIASVSFGESRRFSLKHRLDKGVEVLSFDLEDKSLLMMEGELQHFWQHRIHKTAKQIGGRLNFTFRNILS
jgi:alkylated DNA repair dioxygenase AlkB